MNPTVPPTAPATPSLVPVKLAPFNAESAVRRLESALTPVDAFYVRSNFAVPDLVAAEFRLRVAGVVARELTLSLDELQALPPRAIATVMECAGNNRLQLAPLPQGEPWHCGAVSAGEWTGVPLRDVLERAGIGPGVTEILFEGADHGRPGDGPGDIRYARSLPLAEALAPDVLLAYALNGAPLTRDHGAPLRLVVPRWYGMASVKWLERIEARTVAFDGYYQKSRYVYVGRDGRPSTPVTTMLVKSLVTSPDEGETVARGPCVVRGRAWSGAGEIVRVEVAIGGGGHWRDAELLPAAGPCTWRAWRLPWTAEHSGRHAVRSRATDSAGNVQPDAPPWNALGYGNNAVRPVVFTVS